MWRWPSLPVPWSRLPSSRPWRSGCCWLWTRPEPRRARSREPRGRMSRRASPARRLVTMPPMTDRPVLDHWRTSESDPYPVDWVDLRRVPGLGADAEASGGRLGMSFAPGKLDPYWRHDRDFAPDVQRIRAVHAVDALVVLVQDDEAHDLRLDPLPDVTAAAGIELVRYPITDFGVPH